MEDEDCLHDVGDVGRTAAELPQEAPAFQHGHGLLSDAADLGVTAVVPSLPSLEPAPREGTRMWRLAPW